MNITYSGAGELILAGSILMKGGKIWDKKFN